MALGRHPFTPLVDSACSTTPRSDLLQNLPRAPGNYTGIGAAAFCHGPPFPTNPQTAAGQMPKAPTVMGAVYRGGMHTEISCTQAGGYCMTDIQPTKIVPHTGWKAAAEREDKWKTFCLLEGRLLVSP